MTPHFHKFTQAVSTNIITSYHDFKSFKTSHLISFFLLKILKHVHFLCSFLVRTKCLRKFAH